MDMTFGQFRAGKAGRFAVCAEKRTHPHAKEDFLWPIA